MLIRLADADSNLDKTREAQDFLKEALAIGPSDADSMFDAASIYERLGDRQFALQWLERAIRGGYPRDLIEKDPALARLRLDPKYRELIGP